METPNNDKYKQCEGCLYHMPLTSSSNLKICHHLLLTGKRRRRDGDKCLSNTPFDKEEQLRLIRRICWTS